MAFLLRRVVFCFVFGGDVVEGTKGFFFNQDGGAQVTGPRQGETRKAKGGVSVEVVTLGAFLGGSGQAG